MAISRHKVLSEMQQQLELASSKCGNLQKQLEIVKDKVRLSSTTNLTQMEPPDEKENKLKNGKTQGSSVDTERSREYEQALSLSSSSTEDVNDERDVNIIKVFYDRLGQMDYPTGQVELSDISSEDNDNDLDIDQLLSTVNFSIGRSEKTENEKRKEKRRDKKGKDKSDKPIQKAKKVKNQIRSKVPPFTNPYESHLHKPLSQKSPVKLKNHRNKQKSVRLAIDAGSGNIGNKPISRGPASKSEIDKSKKKRQATGSSHVLSKNSSKNVFQEPIKRVMNLASALRKTKSSTGAEKRETFPDSRSLTRLHPEGLLGYEMGMNEGNSGNTLEAKVVQTFDLDNEVLGSTENMGGAVKHQAVQELISKKGTVGVRTVRAKKEEATKLKTPAPPSGLQMKDKGTSLSDLAKMTTPNKSQKPDSNKIVNKIQDSLFKTRTTANKTVEASVSMQVSKNNAASEPKGKNTGLKLAPVNITEKKVKPQEFKPRVIKSNSVQPKIMDTKEVEGDFEINRSKNGILPHTVLEEKLGKSDIRRKMNIFEKSTPKDVMVEENVKKEVAKEKYGSKRGTPMTITRANSKSTFYDDVSRRGQEEARPASAINNVPPAPPPVYGYDARDKDPGDISPVTISQIRRMKDNLMKFNAIPFIVGQSTTKSYHIGLNIQQTYSLFKQTPSMTALKVSKFADSDHQSILSRAKSTRTGFSGRTMSSIRGGMCPACGPAPDPSPEQLADPWAVPQDDDVVIRVCTCLPKRIISFDQVLNQLYFTDMNFVKLHPNLINNKDGISKESDLVEVKDKTATVPHRGTNTLHYTKLLRSIQTLKDNILG